MTEVSYRIDALGAQGDGIVRTTAGDVHVKGALPGEEVIEQAHGTFALAAPTSPDRRPQPLCSAFPRCGGCTAQHMSEDLYRNWKNGLLGAALATRGIALETAPMLSVPLHSRRRASFAVAWIGAKAELGLHGLRSHDVVPVPDCAVLHPQIVATLPALGDIASAILLPASDARIAVLATRTGLDVAIEVKGKPPAPKDTAALGRLCRAARIARLSLAGLPLLQLTPPIVDISGVPVTPPPGAFLQASVEAESLIADLVVAAAGKARRVADLFSGAGTLSFALARRARVLAVDSDQTLLHALSKAAHGVQGLKPIDTSRRDLFRDPLAPLELKTFDAVVLDPPRSGADAQARALAQSAVKTVVMVSCNPATLARDLRTLIDGGYRLTGATPVDQFLYSAHLEAVAVLTRA